MRSKSTLVAVAQQACTETNIYYFPSYEMVSALGRRAYKGDGRHVKPRVVDAIMAGFIDATSQDGTPVSEDIVRQAQGS